MYSDSVTAPADQYGEMQTGDPPQWADQYRPWPHQPPCEQWYTPWYRCPFPWQPLPQPDRTDEVLRAIQDLMGRLDKLIEALTNAEG